MCYARFASCKNIWLPDPPLTRSQPDIRPGPQRQSTGFSCPSILLDLTPDTSRSIQSYPKPIFSQRDFTMSSPTEWYKDNFLFSTNPSLIQLAAVNAAFATDYVHWAKPMKESLLKKMLDNSHCFGVYELPKSSAEIAGKIQLSFCFPSFSV